MRVVLDTNVIVSAALTTHGTCAQIVEMLGEGVFEICADGRILDEYDSVLRRPELRIVPENLAIVMEMIRQIAVPVAAVPLAVELPDPDDRPFLEVAAAADALLVTGNARHYPRRASAGVKVISPAEFLELVRRPS
jgi:putative PIN family toxin of toxin-antitoxin system